MASEKDYFLKGDCEHFRILLRLPSAAKGHQILTQGNSNFSKVGIFLKQRKDVHCCLLHMQLGKKSPRT